MISISSSCQKNDLVKESIRFTVQLEPIQLDRRGLTEWENMDFDVEQTIQALHNRFKLFEVKNLKVKRVANSSANIIVEIPKKDIILSTRNKKIQIPPEYLARYLFSFSKFMLELRLCAEGPQPAKEYLLQPFAGEIPDNMEIISKHEAQEQLFYLLQKTAIVTNRDIIEGKMDIDSYGNSGVVFKLNENGAKKLEQLTSQNVDRQLAILLDGELIYAATILEPLSDEVRISGAIDPFLARIMVVLMKAGPLPSHLVLPTFIRILDKTTFIDSQEK
jgi:preprotein translocase subunit SecD